MDLEIYIQQTLKAIDNNRLPHAILVETENGNDAQQYVFECANHILKTTKAQTHPDFLSYTPEGKTYLIRIESIRELAEYVQKTPHTSSRKVVAIFDAHRLHKNAAEALLKTLEEPPNDTTLLLTVPSKNLLLPTIISRCVLHHLPQNSQKDLPPWLVTWLYDFRAFLQKLQSNPQNVNILEVFDLLEKLSKSIEILEKNNNNDPEKSFTQNTQQSLLKAMTETIGNVFHPTSSACFLKHRMDIIRKSSELFSVNSSFINVIESILLQLYLTKPSGTLDIYSS